MAAARLASVDVGSNTFRLLVADAGPDGRLAPAALGREIVRLGGGVGANGRIGSEAFERGQRVLESFAGEIERTGAAEAWAVGTQVLRVAANSAEFVREAARRSGLRVRVIDGLEEARLTRLGVLGCLPGAGREAVIFDLGGGSCEFSFEPPEEGAPPELASLPLGAVSLTERAGLADPPGEAGRRRLAEEARRALEPLTERARAARRRGRARLVGTAGTVTTLAAMELGLERYEPDRISGFRLARRAADERARELAALKIEERRGIAGLEPGREEIILAGAVIVSEILELFEQEEVLVSDGGLLEGIILDRLKDLDP